MDVTPLISSDAQVIQSYAQGGFKVSGVQYDGSIFVFPDRVEPWALSADMVLADLTLSNFEALIAMASDLDVVLLGTGAKMQFLPPAMRLQLKQAGLQVEYMDTAAACRTYNVLLSEGRRVVAALMPVT